MEHLLAKERVAGSIPVSRSWKSSDTDCITAFFESNKTVHKVCRCLSVNYLRFKVVQYEKDADYRCYRIFGKQNC